MPLHATSTRRRRRWAAACLLWATWATWASTESANAESRIDVGWISREPRLPPPNSLTAPVEEGWPAEGDRVQWVAHILNRGTETVADVPFAWTIDDGTSESGRVDLPPGETTVWLSWRWTFSRHAVSFRIGTASPELTVASDALSLGLWVVQDTYDWLLEDDGPGLEPLMQEQIANWNALLARAVHPSTPQGALDRIRLDAVLIRPDDAEPQHGEMDTDLQWWYVSRPGSSSYLHRRMNLQYLHDQTIVLHELLHQRGLSDLYAYAVRDTYGAAENPFGDSRIDIVENGRRVAGTALMPARTRSSSGVTVYWLPHEGLMGTRYFKSATLTEHSTYGLNLRAGRRTPRWFDRFGNGINGFADAFQPYSYLSRVPQRTVLRFVDESGTHISQATVDVYLDHNGAAYRDYYRENPDRTLVGDERGVVFPADVLSAAPMFRDTPPKSMVVILGVRTPGARGFTFLPLWDLNLLWFRGNEERAELEMPVVLHPW